MTGSVVKSFDREDVATEFALVVGMVVGFYLWHRGASRVATELFDALALSGGLLVEGLSTNVLMLAGLLAFTGAYARLRDIQVGLALPARGDFPLAVVALVAPAGLVGLTKLVGDATGVAYNALTMTSYASDAPVSAFLTVTGLGLFLGIPTYLLLCQVVVQGSFQRVVGSDAAIVATTAVAGFLLADVAGGLSPVPGKGRVLGAIGFALALGLAGSGTGLAYGEADDAEQERLRYLSYFPLVALGVLAVGAALLSLDSVAGALFGVTQVVVLGLAAYTYDRTDSLVVPALAYLSLSLSNSVVVFAFEAGMQNW